MSALARLLKVGTVADSMGAYVPAMAFQKALGLGRVLLFAHLMRNAKDEYGLWGLAMMIFTLLSPLMTFGSNQGLSRYVSFYEARGRLREFYRSAGRAVLLCAAVVAGVGLLVTPGVVSLLVHYRGEAAGADPVELRHVVMLAVANAFVMALHSNMVGFMVGLRAYRLVAAVEVFFSVVFTVFGVAALLAQPTSILALMAHLASLVASLAFGMFVLDAGVRGLLPQGGGAPPERKVLAMEPHEEPTDIAAASERPVVARGGTGEDGGTFGRIVKFGVVSMIGSLLWLAAQYVSFLATYLRCGERETADFTIFLQLSQPGLFIANAAWAVIFTHVARYWETGKPDAGLLVLETSYKAISIVMMTMTILIYVSAPWWVKALPGAYQKGLPLLGGLLAFFQVVTHLAVMTILAKLRERPSVIAAAAVAGIAANWLLAAWWMGDASDAPAQAAWAAGFGMFIGTGVVTAAWFLAARVRLHAGTWFVLGSPAILLATRWMPVWSAAVAWCAVCAVALFTRLLFTPREKQLLGASLKRLWAIVRKVVRPA